MNGDALTVSVLVPLLNEGKALTETVQAMRAQRLAGTVELIFIDGGSEDGTRNVLERLQEEDPRIRLLHNPARHTTHALNIGLRAARGEFVARMDAHTVYPSDYLAKGIERLQRGDVEWVAGPQIPRGSGRWSHRVELALRSRLGVGGAAFRRLTAEEFDSDAGFTGIWRRATLEAHGGWDEDWPVNQDGELAARIRKAGGRIVCVPDMAAYYVPRDSLRGLARQYWRYGQYRAKTSRRHPESMRLSQLAPPVLALTAATAVLPGSLGRASRMGLGLYAMALAGAAIGALPRARHPREAALVPVALTTMHLVWGAGFLIGSARFGPPLAAVRLVLSVHKPGGGTP